MERDNRPHPPPGSVFDRMTVTVRGDDHTVTATFTPRGGITVRLDAERLPGHTDSSLARQLGIVLNKILAGSRQAGKLAAVKAFGEPEPEPEPDTPTERLAAGRGRRGRLLLAATNHEGRSPLDDVRVGFNTEAGFNVDIEPGAVRGNTPAVMESEVNAAIAAALTSYLAHLNEVHDTVLNRAHQPGTEGATA